MASMSWVWWVSRRQEPRRRLPAIPSPPEANNMAMGGGGANKGLENEINVTPMIDVLLVLLIIFMAALPTMRKAIDVQLPDPNPTVQPANANSNQIVLEILTDGSYSINTKHIAREALHDELNAIYDPRPEKIIFVKGNPKVKFGA